MLKKCLRLVLLAALLVPLGARAQNTQTFDFEDNAIPASWTNGTTYPWTVTNVKNHTSGGTYCIKSGNAGVNSTNSSIEATFVFNDEGSISFWCWSSCESASNMWDYGEFYVDNVQVDYFLDMSAWQQKSYTVSAGSHTFKWVYHKDYSQAGGDDCFYIDDIVVDLGEVPSCFPVSNLHIDPTATTTSSITLVWSDAINTGATYSVYLISGSDTTAVNAANVTFSDTTAIVTGLANNTPYTFGVRSNCGVGGLSRIRTVSGRTACAPYPLPFVAYFEASVNDDPCWSGATGITADSVFNGGVLTLTTPQWSYVSSVRNGLEAGHYFKNIYGTSCKAWMITPEIDLSTATAPQLTFDVALTKYSSDASAALPDTNVDDDKFMVLISTDGGATWPAANAIKWQKVGGDSTYLSLASLTYQNKVIDLTQYVGQTIRVAFYGESTVSNGDNNLHIDNVIVGEAPTCESITNLAVGDIFGRTADLTWSGSANSYEVEYRKASDGVWTVMTANDTSATVTGLEPLTPYKARVTAVCSDGPSYPSPVISFTTKAACQVPTNVSVEALAREATVTWRDTIANAWQIQYIAIGDSAAANDTSDVFSVTDASSYTLFNLNPESSYKVRVLADCGNEDSLSAWTTWKSFSTPAACLVPTGLNVTLTPGNGTVASISWIDTLASSWQLMVNNDSLNPIDVYEMPFEFDTLTPEATYTVCVRANCDNDGYSHWSSPKSFIPTNAYSITVNDGTTTNDYVPIYGLWTDNHIKSRFIIPASGIAAMQYGSVTELTFYASQSSVSWGAAEFEVYMSQTSDSIVSTVNEVEEMTQVYTGRLSISNNKMVVTLTQPFQYMGENLLIAFEQPVSGSYVTSTWYGVTTTGASMGGYGSNVSQQNFLPKMTFVYTPGEAPACDVPTNLVCTDTTGHTATLTWEGETGNAIIEYKEASVPNAAWEEVSAGSSPFVLDGLAHSTSYNVRVKVDCDEETYYSNVISILTKTTCYDPSNITVMPVEGSSSSVLVSWTDSLASEWELFTMLNGDSSQTYSVYANDTVGGYLVQNLIPEARYSVWVRAICDASEGDISGWIGTNFVPSASVRTTLGTPETTDVYLPTYSLYNYALTQQIYTATELGDAPGYITGIDFLNGGSEKIRDIDIYMIHTSDTAFASESDWFAVTAANKVFSGEVTFVVGDWTTISFDRPFNFNGDSNVVLVVDDNTGSYSGGLACYVYPSTGNQAICVYSDGTDYDPIDPDYSGTLLTVKSHIRFAIGEPPACAKPTNVAVSNMGSTDAILTWNDTVANAWQIMINGDAANPISATNDTIQLTGLTANTNYTINVRAVCSAEEISEWSIPVSFRTYAPAASVPYSTGFEAGQDGAWAFRNGANAWMIGNATHSGTGTNALYISQNGTANTYNIGSATVSYAFRMLDITTSGDYYCTFDWKGNGEDGYDFMRAWLVPIDSFNVRANLLPDASSFSYSYQTATPEGWFDLGGKMNGTGSWQEVIKPVNITVAGTYALVFMWVNDNSSGSNPPAAVDNIWFGIPTCSMVTEVGVDSASRTDSTIYFSWTPGGDETAWEVKYNNNSDTVNVPQYALQHLSGTSNFTIKVRALCSDEDQSFWKEIRGHLPCTPDTVPFLNDFDNLSGTFTNRCWGIGNSAGQVQDGYQNWPYAIAFTGATNDKLLFLNKGAYVILPDLNVPLNQLYLSFDFSSGNDSSVLYLGYATNTQVAFEKVTFFDTLYHVDYATEAEFRGRVEMLLNNLPAEAHNLVIASDEIGTGHYVGLNELNLTLPPTCGHVENVVATPVSETSVTLSWDTSIFGTAQSYIVEYGPRLFTPGTGTVVTTPTNSITINGLNPATPYEAYIVTDCGADTSDGILPVSFAGTCGTLSVPDTFTFSEYMMSGRSLTGVMPNCWAIDSASRIYSEDSILAQVYGANSNTQMTFLMYDQAVVAMPAVNKPLDSLMLTFDMSIADESMALVVGAVSSQANGFGSTFVPIDTLRYNDNGYGVITYLAPYTGNFQHIAFKNIALDTTVDAAYVAIDNLVVSMAPTCLPIVDLRATDSTINSVTIDWSSIVNDAPAWEMAYRPAGATSATHLVVTSHPVTLQNLDTNTAYNISVRPICSASDTGEWSDVLVANTDVCIGVAVRNFTSSDATSSYSPIGYSYYNYSYVQTIIDSADMAAIYGAPINTIGFITNSDAGGAQFNNMHVYMANVSESNLSSRFIKPDTNHVFVEVFRGGSMNYTTAGMHYFSFDTTFTWDGHSNVLVAVNRLNGAWGSGSVFAAHNATTAKMRYVYQDASSYNINTVTGGTPSTVVGNIILLSCDEEIICDAPELVAIDTTTETSIGISINGTADNYEVLAVEGNDWNDDTTGIAISGTSYTFTGLTPGTQYTIGVRSVCAAGLVSEWVLIDTTTEAHPCAVPTGLTATNISLTSATLGWSVGEAGQVADWQVHLFAVGYDNMIVVTGATSYDVTGLPRGTEFTFKVRAICGVGDTSDWSAPKTFSTLDCQAPTNVQAGNMTSNSAVVTWTAPAGVSRFIVDFGASGHSQGAGTSDTVNGTSYTITGLEADMAYDVYVQTICADGVVSDWSTAAEFTTLAGIDDVNAASVSLYPNPASSTVTLTGIEGVATVTVVDMNGRENGKWTVSDGTLTIDVSQMSQGAYFVRIVGEQVNAIRKLIVR